MLWIFGTYGRIRVQVFKSTNAKGFWEIDLVDLYDFSRISVESQGKQCKKTFTSAQTAFLAVTALRIAFFRDTIVISGLTLESKIRLESLTLHCYKLTV